MAVISVFVDAERQYLTNQKQSQNDETRILGILSKGLSSEFPNPGRVGCPGAAVLEGIASHCTPLSEAEKWLAHLGSCSSCFQEFTAIRNRRRRQSRLRWGGGLAVLLAALALWFTLRSHKLATETAVLDLRAYSGQRGQENVSAQAPLQLQRNAKHLVLYLPIGSKEGSYEFALLNETGEELLHGSGTARLADHVVVLRAEINLASMPRGSYFLGLRQTAMEWTPFPTKVN